MRTFFLMLVLCSSGLLHAAEADGPPSCEAKGMPGAVGTFELKPPGWIGSPRHPNPPGPTTYWIDSDGVDPGTAGCHREHTSQRGPKVRKFGEYCLPNGQLVESNPGANKLHLHENDLGHPDKFDCAVWCRGQGRAGGSCVPAQAPPCASSAKCVCT